MYLYYQKDDYIKSDKDKISGTNSTSSVAYTQYANIQVEDNMNLTINDNVEFVADILNLSDFI